ncbi:hypothetical protein D3C71_1520120 [compost metagenome]
MSKYIDCCRAGVQGSNTYTGGTKHEETHGAAARRTAAPDWSGHTNRRGEGLGRPSTRLHRARNLCGRQAAHFACQIGGSQRLNLCSGQARGTDSGHLGRCVFRHCADRRQGNRQARRGEFDAVPKLQLCVLQDAAEDREPGRQVCVKCELPVRLDDR